MIELTETQRASVIVTECEYQLTIMKQYLSNEHTAMYIALLKRYANLIEYEHIMLKYKRAW